MANHLRATLESALRSRKLDSTLTSTLPPVASQDPSARAATGLPQVDAALQGGLRRGQVSEIVGTHSSGRTTVLLGLLAEATRRGEIVALIDACDRLDVASAVAAGVDLERVLWVRGQAGGSPVGVGSEAALERLVGRALKAAHLVLQAGGFGVVALDLADVSPADLRRLPATTWLRLQRAIEGSETVGLLLAPQPLGRSAAGVTLAMGATGAAARWAGDAARSRLLTGTAIAGRVVSPRLGADGQFALLSGMPGIDMAVMAEEASDVRRTARG